MEPNSEFDLGSMLGSERRSGRGVTIAGLVIAAIGVLGLLGGVARWILSGLTTQAVVLLVAGPAIFVLGALVSTLSVRMSIKKIRLTDRSIEVLRADGRRRTLDWANPKLQIYLWDRSAVNPGSRSLKGQPSPFFAGFAVISVSSPVPRELYLAVLKRAQSQFLAVETTTITTGEDSGAVRTVVSARK